ncbi:MAG: OmpA family protein [Myxococcota bacterium]
MARNRWAGARAATVTCLVAAAAVLSPRPALSAPVPAGSVHLGVLGGYQLTSSDGDLIGDRRLNARLDDAAWYGLRLGVGLFDPLSLELTTAVMPAGTLRGDDSAVALHGLLEAVAHFLDGPVVIDVAGGAGVSSLVAGDLGTDADLVVSAGFGARWLLGDGRMALRVDARALFSDAEDDPIAAHGVVLGGFDVFLRRPDEDGADEEAPPPPDRDLDGVPDPEDRCPVDTGLRALDGCPDADGDGLADPDDACPEAAGPEALHGCPDADGDGLPDTTDACPSLPGDPRFAGCPDTDDDGLPDGKDACPRLKGEAALEGCPAPSADELALFGRPLESVRFAPGTADLLPRSRPILARIGHVLTAHPHLRAEVRGHTHGGLPEERAYELSEARARAVRRHLVDLGVDARKIGAVGLGAEEPIAGNRTAAGRDRNQRVEVHLVER